MSIANLLLLLFLTSVLDRDRIPRMDERDQTVISAGAGHDARGRENHEFRPPLHHAIQQRGKRPGVAMIKYRSHAHLPSCKYAQNKIKEFQLERTGFKLLLFSQWQRT